MYGLDIGGTLIKLAFFVDENAEFSCENLAFRKFLSASLQESLEFIANDAMSKGIKEIAIQATGGGSFKNENYIRDFFKSRDIRLEFVLIKEMDSLFNGITYLTKINQLSSEKILYANIGTGVSILRIEAAEFSRVGGTGIGGGTFYGLYCLMCKLANISPLDFDDAIDGATFTDCFNSKLHLTVGDIYGADPAIKGLDPTLIAGYFSACPLLKNVPDIKAIAGGLLMMVSYAITSSIAEFSKETNPKIIIIGGSFVGKNGLLFLFNDIATIKNLVQQVLDYNQIKTKVHFLDLGPYVGCIGAMVSSNKS